LHDTERLDAVLGEAIALHERVRRGDVQPIVVAALVRARQLGLRTIALTGRDGGEVGRAADIHITVPSPSTARVQEVHRTLLHVLCELVENAFVA
jgi:D-sedoheptulose 7-phosphate isomerase